MSGLQLDLFTGKPAPARWVRLEKGVWFCLRCLREVEIVYRPNRCGCERRSRRRKQL